MARIHFLGTCSGTEPMVGMHHCSWVLEVGDYYYWFDGGENCAFTAHTSGMDVMRTRALFVSHPHLDHIAGLPNLFSCMRKLIWREKRKLIKDNTLEVFFPGLEIFRTLKLVACSGSDKFKFLFTMNEHEMADGVIYEDELIKVSALHNNHMKEDFETGRRSFSMLIETEGKRIVFSGDVAEPSECDALIGEGCDYFIMETGHHAVKDVCEYALSRNVKALRFNHHGREIIGDRAAAEKLVSDYAQNGGISIKIAYDQMREDV